MRRLTSDTYILFKCSFCLVPVRICLCVCVSEGVTLSAGSKPLAAAYGKHSLSLLWVTVQYRFKVFCQSRSQNVEEQVNPNLDQVLHNLQMFLARCVLLRPVDWNIYLTLMHLCSLTSPHCLP